MTELRFAQPIAPDAVLTRNWSLSRACLSWEDELGGGCTLNLALAFNNA